MVRLRTMTFKSNLDGLSGYNCTVKELFDYKPFDIIKIYYLYEKCNFSEDVILNISKKYNSFYEIKKPGFDKNFRDKLFGTTSYKDKSSEELKKMISAKKINGQFVSEALRFAYHSAKSKEKTISINKSLDSSKSSLRSKNNKK